MQFALGARRNHSRFMLCQQLPTGSMSPLTVES
jgi:hypothetical protein